MPVEGGGHVWFVFPRFPCISYDSRLKCVRVVLSIPPVIRQIFEALRRVDAILKEQVLDVIVNSLTAVAEPAQVFTSCACPRVVFIYPFVFCKCVATNISFAHTHTHTYLPSLPLPCTLNFSVAYQTQYIADS
jgi:hypothetical protein